MASADKLEVVAVDFYSGRDFVLYFSDDTYVALSSASLASYFPDRKSIPLADRREGPKDYVRSEIDKRAS